MKRISVIISSYSTIISSGLTDLLTSLKIPALDIHCCRPPELSSDCTNNYDSAIYFIDVVSASAPDIDRLRQSGPNNTVIVGVYHTALPMPMEKSFDNLISIYSDNTSVKRLVNEIIPRMNPNEDTTDDLTPREKEIVIGVVKGLSNKEIASNLSVSVNTVMTHRRNIASKLQIHSAAGLTIYAIVSKLVSIDEIKGEML